MSDRCEHGMHIDLECADCLALENERLGKMVDELVRDCNEMRERAEAAERERDKWRELACKSDLDLQSEVLAARAGEGE